MNATRIYSEHLKYTIVDKGEDGRTNSVVIVVNPGVQHQGLALTAKYM
jgi:hypothetical protein